MDNSLAKGYKNQLFREISDHVDSTINNFKKYLITTKAGTSLNNWRRFTDGINSALSGMVIETHHGGSKRHPLICISTLDSQSDKSYNSWNERCLNSILILINYSPWHYTSQSVGYSSSEHAIQRIYERTVENSILASTKDKLEIIVTQLDYAPFWAAYWLGFAATVLNKDVLSKISCLIPSPNVS